MRINSKGQVTVPIEIRRRCGLQPDTEVEFVVVEGEVRLRKRSSRRPNRGERLVRTLRGTATVRMSTDEILTLMRGE